MLNVHYRAHPAALGGETMTVPEFLRTVYFFKTSMQGETSEGVGVGPGIAGADVRLCQFLALLTHVLGCGTELMYIC